MTSVQIRKHGEDDQLKVVQCSPDQARPAKEDERTSLKKNIGCEWIQRIIGALFLMGLIVMLILYFTYESYDTIASKYSRLEKKFI